MSELSDALRKFADAIDRGEVLPNATQCAVVLADDVGNHKATYIGRMAPASAAGIHLLACGIHNFNVIATGGYQSTSGSTH